MKITDFLKDALCSPAETGRRFRDAASINRAQNPVRIYGATFRKVIFIFGIALDLSQYQLHRALMTL
jgi:hypothetical protein